MPTRFGVSTTDADRATREALYQLRARRMLLRQSRKYLRVRLIGSLVL